VNVNDPKVTVTSRPSGINCGSACKQSFNDRTNITLTANYDHSIGQVSWDNGCTGDTTVCRAPWRCSQGNHAQPPGRHGSFAAPRPHRTRSSFDGTEMAVPLPRRIRALRARLQNECHATPPQNPEQAASAGTKRRADLATSAQ